jgi:hypothetical protein
MTEPANIRTTKHRARIALVIEVVVALATEIAADLAPHNARVIWIIGALIFGVALTNWLYLERDYYRARKGSAS